MKIACSPHTRLHGVFCFSAVFCAILSRQKCDKIIAQILVTHGRAYIMIRARVVDNWHRSVYILDDMHEQNETSGNPIEKVGIANRSLAEFKNRNNLTNRQIANLFGISPSLVSHHLAGRRAIGVMAAIRINDRTGIPLASLRAKKQSEAKPNDQQNQTFN